MVENSTIKIQRKKSVFNRAREIEIYVDETSKTRLRNGDQVTLDLNPGTYNVNATLGKLGSPLERITLKSGETINLEVFNTPAFVIMDTIIAILFVVVLSLLLLTDYENKNVYFIYVMFGCYVTLKHYILKNKYLTLKIK